MTITRISARALKGRDFSIDTTPTTLIVGPNYSGKTAIIEAVRLTLLGYIPEIGKRNTATFELASGAQMEVELKLDTDARLKRRFWMEKGSVKTDDNIGEAAAEYSTPLLDAGAYFAMTETERTDYVFARVTLPPQFTAAGIIAKLHQLSFGEDHTEELQEAKVTVIATCEKQFRDFPKLADALTALTTATLKEQFTITNARAKDTAGAIRTLTELKLREDECSAVTLTDLRNEAARLDGLLAEAQREHGALTERAAAAAKLLARRRELETLLAAPEPEWPLVPQPPSELPEIARLQTELDAVNAAIDKLPDPDGNAESNANRAKNEWTVAAGELRDARKRLVDAITAVEEFDALECCPTCKAKGKGWKAGVLASLNITSEVASVAVDKAIAAEEIAKASSDKAIAECDAARAAAANRSELCAKAVLLGREIDAAKLRKSENARRHEVAVAQQQRNRDQWKNDRTARTQELARMEEVAGPTEDETVASRAAVLNIEADRTVTRGKITAAERLQNDLRRAAEAARENTLAVAKVDVIKLVGKTLKEQKAEMVAAAFGALLVTANSICGGILPSPLAFHEGEIGRWGSNGFICHRVFSGVEKLLAYVSIAAALSSTAPFKLLILDELARATGAVQAQILASLEAAVKAGTLDQVVVVLPSDEPVEVEGWTVVQMREAVAA